MLNEQKRNELKEKIRLAGGDARFADALTDVLTKEDLGAERSKKEYFLIENLVVWVSMFSTIMAGISSVDVMVWQKSNWEWILPWVEILSIALPAVVTMLVAYKGVKRSYETWIRHRKYSLKLNLLINDYLYGSEEFDEIGTEDAYKKFRNEVHKLWRESADEFLVNMSK